MRSNEFHGKDSIRYNGSERICSRLGDNVKPIAATGNGRLAYRTELADWLSRSELQELVSIYGYSAGTPATGVNVLISTGSPNDIFYYHTNHLGSTAFTTDGNATITQGFLYAPFGEITTEYTPMWQNGLIPKYAFNAKELDEETGMYYYEARYMAPPTFISRDPHFERYFWMTPYAYCANNPMKYVDPSGEFPWLVVWGIIEVGVAVYYAYETGTTILDPNASLGQKIASAGGFALGAVLPGGGYGKGAKFGIKQIEKLSKAGVTTGKKLNNIRGFASRNQLNDRFLRHGKEFGDKYKTAEEYLKGAQSFFKKEGEDIIQYSRKNGDIVKMIIRKKVFIF